MVQDAYEVKPPGEARPDFDIIVDLARRMGYGHLFPFKNTEEAFEEIKKATAGGPGRPPRLPRLTRSARGAPPSPCR